MTKIYKNPQEDEPTNDGNPESPNPSRVSNATNIPLNMRADLLVEPGDSDVGNSEANTSQQTKPLIDSPDGLAVRARKQKASRQRRERRRNRELEEPKVATSSWIYSCLMVLCRNSSNRVQWSISALRCLGHTFVWCSISFLVAAVFWYSYELHRSGETEPIKIAWFSAGAFVLLGFPISMYGIISHLANYNQPHVQVYIVRVLWMVPIYSIESWLAMRFHKHAIYIETLRDFYESYVLYSFLQFLIQVLGGEDSLILMLKDKSPTRGFHMWGLQFCLKPWIMGQPVRKTVYERADQSRSHRAVKRVIWKSPFFIQCKFGVLQYVLLKFLSAIVVLLLEWKGLYHEGDFSWQGGYLYICIITNLSQCWALYCLIFFYLATKNELAPIRPVGKFLSVKALVFFTWWQSVMLAILYQWGMIPQQLVNTEQNYTEEDVAKGIQDYLICIEMFVAALVHSYVFPHTEYSPQAVRARNRALHRHQDEMANGEGSEKWNSRRLGRSKFHPQPYARLWNAKDDTSKGSWQTGVELTSVDSPVDSRSSEREEAMLWQNIQPQQQVPKDVSSWDAPWQVTPGRKLNSKDSEGGTKESNTRIRTLLSPVEDVSDDEAAVEDVLLDSFNEGDDEDETEVSVRDSEHEDETYKPGFIRALLDSAIPRDLGDSTLGIVKGEFNVEKKTLLSVATTSDQYDLFSTNRSKRKELKR